MEASTAENTAPTEGGAETSSSSSSEDKSLEASTAENTAPTEGGAEISILSLHYTVL